MGGRKREVMKDVGLGDDKSLKIEKWSGLRFPRAFFTTGVNGRISLISFKGAFSGFSLFSWAISCLFKWHLPLQCISGFVLFSQKFRVMYSLFNKYPATIKSLQQGCAAIPRIRTSVKIRFNGWNFQVQRYK